MKLLYISQRFDPLFFSTEDAEHIFEAATAKNLTGAGYAWIVTEQALNAVNVPLGKFLSYTVHVLLLQRLNKPF